MKQTQFEKDTIMRKFKGKIIILTLMLAASYAGYSLWRAPKSETKIIKPPEVTVKTLAIEKVTVWKSYSGRLTAVDSAEIRPEVSGRITEVRFKDGDYVKAGDVLVVIDPRAYEAALSRAEANASLTAIELQRAGNLVKSNVIARKEYDQRMTKDKIARAELQAARVNVDYAYIKSPINGRVGRAEITVGNHVEAGPNAPLLTMVVADKDIYADFEVDEQTYMKAIHIRSPGHATEQKIPVQITVQGAEEQPYEGTIYTFDNRIMPGSGTIRARAKFANKDGALVPGLFVTVEIASINDTQALLIPARAVSNDQSKQFVYSVDKEGKVAYREVTLGAEVKGQRIVTSGLNVGDQVIMDGLLHARPGAIVTAKETDLKSSEVLAIADNIQARTK